MIIVKKFNKLYFLLIIYFIFFFSSSVFASDNLRTSKINMQSFGGKAGYEIAFDKSNTLLIIGTIIKSLTSFLGVVFLVLFVYGGFLWMQARGDSDAVSKAKETMINASIGIFIVLASFFISTWIVERLISTTMN